MNTQIRMTHPTSKDTYITEPFTHHSPIKNRKVIGVSMSGCVSEFSNKAHAELYIKWVCANWTYGNTSKQSHEAYMKLDAANNN